MRFPADARTMSAFDQLKITTPTGAVPASYFIKRVPAQQVTQIQRREGQRLVLLQANTVNGVAANLKIAEVKQMVSKMSLDPAVQVKFIGADEEGAKAQVFFAVAMATSLFLMGVILLWQFNSFYGVLVTLSAVALSTIGVLLGVQLNVAHTFDYLSVIMLGTGIVALAGVVVGHNIVLVDTFYQSLRLRQGFLPDEAAIRAATQRFRPVMLTTLVTVVGLLPLMFQIHPNFHNGHLEYKAPGSEWWVQLSASVVWGLSFATLLTLVLTPVLLAAPQVASRRFAAALRRNRKGDTPELGPPEPYDIPRAAE